MSQTIMIVDDASDLREVLKLYLTNAGYEVMEAVDGQDALDKLAQAQISLMILDIMMPRMDGYQFIETLGTDRDFPVIFLSAKSQVQDKIKGLHLGADDFIAKPFEPAEVLARVMAVLRRVQAQVGQEVLVNLGSLRWEVDNRQVYLGDQVLDLRAKEYQLLTLFMRRPGKVYTKQEIYELLWGEDYFYDDNTIMVHISNLRDKVETNPKRPERIVTIRGIGYMMPKDQE